VTRSSLQQLAITYGGLLNGPWYAGPAECADGLQTQQNVESDSKAALRPMRSMNPGSRSRKRCPSLTIAA
jgi:hypothetical protein